MKKNLILIILFLILVFISGCSNNKEYTILFDTKGGTAIQSVSGLPGSILKVKKPSKEHYIFKGWYLDNNCIIPFDGDTIPEKNIILYAKWEPIVYTIKLNIDNEFLFDKIEARFGDKITAPENPTKPGYTFDGWYWYPHLETKNKIKFKFDTMPGIDNNCMLNKYHLPQTFPMADYSYGEVNDKDEFIPYTEQELNEKFIANLDTFSEIFRGNTIFITQLSEDYTTLIKTNRGITYWKPAADYIEKHNLATVINSGFYWQLENVKDELLNGYGVHINCKGSPITNNPFMPSIAYYKLLQSYTLFCDENNKHYVSLNCSNYMQYKNTVEILFGRYNLKKAYFTTIDDEQGNPIVCGGFHALDSNNDFMYDENGKPVHGVFNYEYNLEYPIIAAVLVAEWILND